MRNFEINKTEDYNRSSYLNANQAWTSLYYGLNIYGDESAPRGLKVRETLDCDIKILNPMDNLVYSKSRVLSPSYLAFEWCWYLEGDNKVDKVAKRAPFWKTIANDDGTVNSNYGYYIFRKNDKGINEIDKIVEILSNDHDSRKAIIQLPIMGTRDTKDTICTSSIQFIIRNNHLNCIVYMRSNDLMKGFCNDVFMFTMIQIMVANILGVELGWYRHVVGSMHIYESDFVENNEYVSLDTLDTEEFEFVDNKYSESFTNDIILLRDRCDQGIQSEVLRTMLLNWKFLRNLKK